MNRLSFILSAILLLEPTLLSITAEPYQDKQALLDFLYNMHYSHSLDWNVNESVCDKWTGVTCNEDHSRVIALVLPGARLGGHIASNTLSRLSAIQILSLSSNRILGSFPSDFSKLGNLTALYLQSNKFTGPLPLDFEYWENLSALDLSDNRFNGTIPSSVSKLTHLRTLNLANNLFSGEIPDMSLLSLQRLNLANNNLTGNVPWSLSRFPSQVFAGNNLLLENAIPPTVQSPKKRTKKLSHTAILGIALGGSVVAFVGIVLLLIHCYSSKEQSGEGSVFSSTSQTKEGFTKKADVETERQDNRIVFFEGCNLAFDLEDLLRASAEILGRGTFGTAYRAALEDTTLVVKRLKEVTVGKKDFEQLMELVGKIRHENVSALRAYYHSKDEKLIVYDYHERGSLSVMLHGQREERRTPLDWDSRLKLAIGAARGIAYIHMQNGGKLLHGNIKASNIFLNAQGYGCVSDIGLATILPTPPTITSGYRAPEVTDTRKATQASDVYSFGIILLELLTGKFALHATGGSEIVYLVRWVQSVVREQWTGEVFDLELLKSPNVEEEMVEMLRIGMTCVARIPEQRPKMPDVVKMVEEIHRPNTYKST